MLDEIWPLLDRASPSEILEFNKKCARAAIRATNLQRTQLGDLADNPTEEGGRDIAEKMENAFNEAADDLRESGEETYEEYRMTYRMARATSAVAILCSRQIVNCHKLFIVSVFTALDNDPTEIVKLAKEILHV